ncbi:MAG: hypothetical protein NC911_03275 [Candidatus Omnitrophica bacterium]|nr:hypothetical protein [Candidatus Omnitrophota bacterium]
MVKYEKMGTNILLVAGFSLVFLSHLSAREEKDIIVPEVLLKGDFYAAGEVVFPPGVVSRIENMAVQEKEAGRYLPAKITVLDYWPDGSIQRAEIIFAVASNQVTDYKLVYGPEVANTKFLTQTAVLPTVSFSLAGLPRLAENMNVPVGEINVRVERSPDIRYYWHLAPLGIIVFLLFWRSKRWRTMERKG